MREILFRGKRVDNGAWETGSLVLQRMGTSEENAYIADKMTAYHTPIFSRTIGEFTGLTDCNGNKIFEGDIVTCCYGGKKYKGKIIYWDCAFCVSYSAPIKFIGTLDDIAIDCEIIGNIHDNPELLGGDDHD